MTFLERCAAEKTIDLIKCGNYNTDRPSNIVIPELCQAILLLHIRLARIERPKRR